MLPSVLQLNCTAAFRNYILIMALDCMLTNYKLGFILQQSCANNTSHGRSEVTTKHPLRKLSHKKLQKAL